MDSLTKISSFASSSLSVTNSNNTQYMATGSKVSNAPALSGGAQVVALLDSDDNGVTYLRPLNENGFAVNQAGNNQSGNQIILLPVTIPGAKPGEQPTQQILQIQLVNAVKQEGESKLLSVSLQDSGQGMQITPINNQLPEGIQLQLQQTDMDQSTSNDSRGSSSEVSMIDTQVHCNENEMQDVKPSLNDLQQNVNRSKQSISAEEYNQQAMSGSENLVTFTPRMSNESFPMSFHHFLQFHNDTGGNAESLMESQPMSINNQAPNDQVCEFKTDESGLTKDKKRIRRRKPPKPKRPRPGQVQIATTLDGLLLFCCPECNMAYQEIKLLQQHLLAHKIERRYICDICGAGLKRKEHLERHKLGHNPERPYVCDICNKGFKRKEHLNLHTVIHSGEKTEICGECGKGFYRRDHLRKHAGTHVAKRLREELKQGMIMAQPQDNNNIIEQHSTTQQGVVGNVLQVQGKDGGAILIPITDNSSHLSNNSQMPQERRNLIISDFLQEPDC